MGSHSCMFLYLSALQLVIFSHSKQIFKFTLSFEGVLLYSFEEGRLS